MDKQDYDRILREMGVSGGIAGFQAEATEWAKASKQCVCCQAWALLDKSGKCSKCQEVDKP